MEHQGLSFIGFERSAFENDGFQAHNPITDESLNPIFWSAHTDEINKALDLSVKAYEEYLNIPLQKKCELLNLIATKIEIFKNEIIERAQLETALPEIRLNSEVNRTCNQIRMFSDLIKNPKWMDIRHEEADLNRKPKPRPETLSYMIPIGPVAVFCASNFPLAFSVAGGDTISALAAGNPVVVVAHTAHPGTSEIVGKIIVESIKELCLPEGLFSLIYCCDYSAGKQIVNHKEIKAVAFTGSKTGGHEIMKMAQNRKNPIPVYAEMSCINPVFLFEDALNINTLEITQGLFSSVTLGSGQFCTKPGVVFVKNGKNFENLKKIFLAQCELSNKYTLLTRGIKNSFEHKTNKRISQNHVSEFYSKKEMSNLNSFQVNLQIHETNIDSYLENDELNEEVFGPYCLFVKYNSDDDLQKIERHLNGCLTISVFGTQKDFDQHKNFIQNLSLKCGRFVFNDYPTGVEVNHTMVHGGPYPSTSDARFTSVGSRSIYRFVRPVCFQNPPRNFFPS